MEKISTLRDGLISELSDLYSAEHQLLKTIPKMVKKASNEKLKEALESHLKETEKQCERLDQIASELDEDLSGKTCKAMQGLIEEGKEAIEQKSDNEALLDAILVGAAQRIEHYEIAAYSTARDMASELKLKTVVSLIEKTLAEESAASKKLFSLSTESILPASNSDEFEEIGEEDDDESDINLTGRSKDTSEPKRSKNHSRAVQSSSK